MNRFAVVAILFLLSVSTAHGQHATATSQIAPPRYQILAATVQAATVPAPDQVVIKLDTQTGRAWILMNVLNKDRTAWIRGWAELPDLGQWQNPPPYGKLAPDSQP